MIHPYVATNSDLGLLFVDNAVPERNLKRKMSGVFFKNTGILEISRFGKWGRIKQVLDNFNNIGININFFLIH